jgi:anaerobic magnesium-protoporphyrin IX monomethyl ester cyclase
MKRVLLVLPSYRFLYESTIIRAGAVYSPILSLATIAGMLTSRGIDVRILDLNKSSDEDLAALIKTFDPGYAGITFATPLAEEAFRLAGLIRRVKKEIVIIGGGAHSSAMPLQVLTSSDIDVACMGEGEYALLDIVNDKPCEDIEGIAFKRDGECPVSRNVSSVKDLDSLPFPAWKLFDLAHYKTTRLLARKSPVAMMETSRGCPYACIYCSKKIFGRTFRAKSVRRVVDEMEYVLSCGFREVHIIDDCFTYDIERAKSICKEMLKRKISLSWSTINGIRVDNIDRELMHLMRKAGCYRVCFGIESGDDAILKKVHKNQTCDRSRQAVRTARQAGMEIFGFFMLALPGETRESMQKTIDFAKELDLDMAKIAITIPLPGTALFEELERTGNLKSIEWSKFNFYVPAREVYTHPTVDWDTVDVYFKKFYRDFYLRPGFIMKRFLRDLSRGTLIDDMKSALQTKW